MKRTGWLAIVLLTGMSLAVLSGCGPDYGKDVLGWQELPALPDKTGVAGAFAGVSQNALIVAGGANFPSARPWAGGQKAWHDAIYVLEEPEGHWLLAKESLPRPLAYGVSVSALNGVVCAGGGDGSRHFADCFLLRWSDGKIKSEPLPSLPGPAAFCCGAVDGKTLYVAGGRASPDAPATLRTFWAIDLSKKPDQRKWEVLDPWPGCGRMLAVAGVQGGSFYLFSGVDLVRDGEGGLRRRYLTDAYRYTPGDGWHRMPELPWPVAGAPSPAPLLLDSILLVLGGDDGVCSARGEALKDAHPGFSVQILGYDTVKNRWRKMGRVPKKPGPDPAGHPQAGVWPPVTTPTVLWRGYLVVPGGEARPGVRTPRVLRARPLYELTYSK